MNHKDAYRTAPLIKQMCYVRHRGANGLDINRIGNYYQIRILLPIMDIDMVREGNSYSYPLKSKTIMDWIEKKQG